MIDVRRRLQSNPLAVILNRNDERGYLQLHRARNESVGNLMFKVLNGLYEANGPVKDYVRLVVKLRAAASDRQEMLFPTQNVPEKSEATEQQRSNDRK